MRTLPALGSFCSVRTQTTGCVCFLFCCNSSPGYSTPWIPTLMYYLLCLLVFELPLVKSHYVALFLRAWTRLHALCSYNTLLHELFCWNMWEREHKKVPCFSAFSSVIAVVVTADEATSNARDKWRKLKKRGKKDDCSGIDWKACWSQPEGISLTAVSGWVMLHQWAPGQAGCWLSAHCNSTLNWVLSALIAGRKPVWRHTASTKHVICVMANWAIL